MQDVQSVSNITNILSTIIKNAPTLQNVWVHGKISPPLSEVGTLPGYFKLEDVNNSGKFIECVIFEENAPLLADLIIGDNVLVKGRISIHLANKSEYRFVIKDKQQLGTVPDPASVSTLIETLRNTVKEHSAKVQGKISKIDNHSIGFLRLHLKNTNNAEMIVCVLPPNIARRPPFPLQKDTEVSIYGKFDLFTPMFQYQIKIASPNDIQLVQSDLDEDGQTIVDAVQAYLEALKTDEFSVEREHKIQFGSRHGFADVALVDGKGSFAAIAECKGTNFVGHGIEQLKSYLCATDTRFGIFANRKDPEQWEFYENRRRNRIDEIDRSEFEAGVANGITTRERLKDEIGHLNGEIARLENQISELDTTVNRITQIKHNLTESNSNLTQQIEVLESYKSELHEEIHRKLDHLLEKKIQRLERPLSDLKIELQKRGIKNWFKNLFSKENT